MHTLEYLKTSLFNAVGGLLTDIKAYELKIESDLIIMFVVVYACCYLLLFCNSSIFKLQISYLATLNNEINFKRVIY